MNVVCYQKVWFVDAPLKCVRQGHVIFLDTNKQRAIVEFTKTQDVNQRKPQFACAFSDLFPSFEEAQTRLDDANPDEITPCVSGLGHLDMDFQQSVARLEYTSQRLTG